MSKFQRRFFALDFWRLVLNSNEHSGILILAKTTGYLVLMSASFLLMAIAMAEVKFIEL
jgi:hypothetical protein